MEWRAVDIYQNNKKPRATLVSIYYYCVLLVNFYFTIFKYMIFSHICIWSLLDNDLGTKSGGNSSSSDSDSDDGKSFT